MLYAWQLFFYSQKGAENLEREHDFICTRLALYLIILFKLKTCFFVTITIEAVAIRLVPYITYVSVPILYLHEIHMWAHVSETKCRKLPKWTPCTTFLLIFKVHLHVERGRRLLMCHLILLDPILPSIFKIIWPFC